MNKDNYKNAIDQIHASEELKQKTFEKIQNNKRKYNYVKYLVACTAIFVIAFSVRLVYLNKNTENIENEEPDIEIATMNIEELPHFKNIDELKDVLKENGYGGARYEETTKGMLSDVISNADSAVQEKLEDINYSTTNVQVDNVDEADIVKTDGEYIYYITNNKIYIVDRNLEIVSKIYIKNGNEYFSPFELYINKNKLIVLGNYFSYQEKTYSESEDEVLKDRASVTSINLAKAYVYDITEKNSPKLKREVSLDGNYINSRMIGENIYFVSRKYPHYYEDTKDQEILPVVKDSLANESKTIDCTDIIYFKNSKNYCYMLVGSFNINDEKEVNVQTFFGASDNMYVSQKNLYLTETEYGIGFSYIDSKTTIYKFNLNDSMLNLQCKGEVNGYLKNQFSMDEYEGNLRLATTITLDEENDITANNLYILNENLEEIGKIENLAKEEKIYSVRFIGKIGYIVTFKQIDPLFVIDLSNPKEPVVKGELKIPGYSSYLHPYDETHIIGIGNNVKDNGHGGVTNANMKMSMFDVSDLENPKEIFNVDIGNSYADSSISYNHKALFYNKSKNLIGFPVDLRERKAKDDRNGFVVFKIDLEKNEFEKYGEILQEIDYKTNIDRAIYIEDTLYTLADYKIVSYNLTSFEKIKELNLED